MKFIDVSNDLPNGFHDAELLDFNIDYIKKSILMRMKFWVGDMENDDREQYRFGELRIFDVYFCSIEPPDSKYPYLPDGLPLSVSGDPDSRETISYFNEFANSFPSEATYCRFFAHDWNSFINVAANEVQLVLD